MGLRGVSAVGIDAEPHVALHLHGHRPGGATHLQYRLRSNTGHLEQPLIGRGQDVGHSGHACLLQRTQPDPSADQLSQSCDGGGTQPVRHLSGGEHLHLTPRTVPQHSRCREECRRPLGQVPHGCEGRPRPPVDPAVLPRSVTQFDHPLAR